MSIQIQYIVINYKFKKIIDKLKADVIDAIENVRVQLKLKISNY